MLRRPDVDEVKAYGEALGLDLTSTEARIMHSRMMATIDALDVFNELRVEEHRPPLRFTDRDPGYRPTEHEDPLNVFIRKCRVAGADQGPLRGKTIGLKDHISVAGVPLTFGSHLMDGYVPDFDATIVTRLLDAGGTIVGKLKMEEFSWGGPGLSGVGDYVGPMARTVEDVATALACVAGSDGDDPRQAHVPASVPAYTDALSRGAGGLRIGILAEGFGVEGGDRSVDECVREAIHVLERKGARTES